MTLADRRSVPRMAAALALLGLLLALGPPRVSFAQADVLGDATPVGAAVARGGFTVDLGDFRTEAEPTYPADRPGPFPAVLLIPGSSPYDKDFTLLDPLTGAVRSTIFRDIAESLSARGYAVVRYDKHYVTGPNDRAGAQTYYQRFTLPLLLADAAKVYDAARANPRVDPARVVLYGWSEGATIATRLAAERPDVAGLVLHGAPDGTFREVFRYQLRVLAVDFLRDVTDADADGRMTVDELLAAYRRRPGTVAGSAFLFAFDRTSTPAAPKPNGAIDADGDGALAIEDEIVPFLDDFFANFDGYTKAGQSPYGPRYATDAQLPPIVDGIGAVRCPILLLHGEHDANVSPDAAARIDAALAAAGHPDHTLKRYAALGHSLGPAATVYDDAFAPIAQPPLGDVADWLGRRVGRRALPSPPDLGR